MSRTVADATQAGIAYLVRAQLPSGEFPTFAGVHADLTDAKPDPTVFVTSHVLTALKAVPGGLPEASRERALDYLANDRDLAGAWRYWPHGDSRHGWIPPDLDSTSHVASVLREHRRAVPEFRSLMLANRDKEGRFYTWITARWPSGFDLRWLRITVPMAIPTFRYRPWHYWMVTAASRGDLDIVVNANVLAYLGDGPHAAPVVKWLREVIRAGEVESADRWYQSWPAFHYACARAGRTGASSVAELFPALEKNAIERARRHDLPALDVALLGAALLMTGPASPTTDELVGRLREMQIADGSWPAWVFYWGGEDRSIGWGSASLTTAIALEALARSRSPR